MLRPRTGVWSQPRWITISCRRAKSIDKPHTAPGQEKGTQAGPYMLEKESPTARASERMAAGLTRPSTTGRPQEDPINRFDLAQERRQVILHHTAAITLPAFQLAGETTGAAFVIQIVKMDHLRFGPARGPRLPARLWSNVAVFHCLRGLPLNAITFIPDPFLSVP